jgi:hypothetical protein
MLVSAVTLFVPSLLSAQSQDAPKYEVFGGYSWYHAGGSVPPTVVGSVVVNGSTVPNFEKGWAGQFAYNLNHWAGIAVDVNGHYGDFGNAHSVAGGPQFRWRGERFSPFAEALLGWQRIGPKLYPDQNTASFILGGGVDYSVTPRFSIRPIQFDYVNSYYTAVSVQGATNSFNGVRLQAGVVWKLGLPSAETKGSAACMADPTAVDAGVPVKISVTPAGFSPKRILSYSYASTGGRVAGTAAGNSTVDTTGVAPGNYTVTAKVTDDGRGSHQQTASCQAAFSVNEPPRHPPVLSVTAYPASVTSGDSSAITVTGSSPDNRPLRYNCTASAGRLTGNGPAYSLDTAGVPEGGVGVDCTVSDDRNLSAFASTSVKVNVPPPAPVAKDFGLIEFMHDAKRPARVDNEAKGELDRYADALASAPDVKGVIVGYATASESAAKKGNKTLQLAAQRAVDTKDYVTREKGIDPTRVEARTGSGDGQKTELWIVPAGATFPATDTAVVDESNVKAVPRGVLPTRKAAHRKAHKKALNKKTHKK